MRESGYYPPGAEYDPCAPWNEVEIPYETKKVRVNETLTRTTDVEVKDYIPGFWDKEEHIYEDSDFSECNWDNAYDEQCDNALALLRKLKTVIVEHYPTDLTKKEKKELDFLLSEIDEYSECYVEIDEYNIKE